MAHLYSCLYISDSKFELFIQFSMRYCIPMDFDHDSKTQISGFSEANHF